MTRRQKLVADRTRYWGCVRNTYDPLLLQVRSHTALQPQFSLILLLSVSSKNPSRSGKSQCDLALQAHFTQYNQIIFTVADSDINRLIKAD